MKIAITTTAPDIKKEIPVALLTGDFVTRIRKASQLGYDGIELIVNNPDKLDPNFILSTMADFGLEIVAISTGGLAYLEGLTLLSPSEEVEKLAISRLEKLIAFAHTVDAPIVTIGSFRGKTQPQYASQNRSYLKEKLLLCLEQAEKCNIRLVLEPLNRYESNLINTVEEALFFIEEVGSGNLGILVDTYHANIEERSMTVCLQEAFKAQRLWHIHLGDSNRLPPGFGHIDFPAIFSTLKDMPYEGFISAELLPHPDPDNAAAFTIKHYRTIAI